MVPPPLGYCLLGQLSGSLPAPLGPFLSVPHLTWAAPKCSSLCSLPCLCGWGLSHPRLPNLIESSSETFLLTSSLSSYLFLNSRLIPTPTSPKELLLSFPLMEKSKGISWQRQCPWLSPYLASTCLAISLPSTTTSLGGRTLLSV